MLIDNIVFRVSVIPEDQQIDIIEIYILAT